MSDHCTWMYVWDNFLENNPKLKGKPIVSIVFEDTGDTFTEECLLLKRFRRNPIKVNEFVYPLHGNTQYLSKQDVQSIIKGLKGLLNSIEFVDPTEKGKYELRVSKNPPDNTINNKQTDTNQTQNQENNQQTNENKTMKQTIRLTESDLHKLIKEVVNELDLKTYANAAKDDFEDKLYYSEELNREMLQLSDEHTLWKINNGVNDEYYYMVENGLHDLTRKFGTQFYALGRSGRHICVDDTPKNRKRYGKMVAAVEDAERSIIDFFNSERSLDESITRAIRKLLR